MVSLIQSNFIGFGSRYVPGGLGFCLQNRGQPVLAQPGRPERLEPHKRPFHTIIPAFMTRDGRPVFSFGVMGGDFQPQGQVQVLMNLLDFGMSVQQAGEQPRVAHDESSTPTGKKMVDGGTVGLEGRIPDAVRQQLAEMGHKVQPGVGTIRRLPGHLAQGRSAALLRRLRSPRRRLRDGVLSFRSGWAISHALLGHATGPERNEFRSTVIRLHRAFLLRRRIAELAAVYVYGAEGKVPGRLSMNCWGTRLRGSRRGKAQGSWKEYAIGLLAVI